MWLLQGGAREEYSMKHESCNVCAKRVFGAKARPTRVYLSGARLAIRGGLEVSQFKPTVRFTGVFEPCEGESGRLRTRHNRQTSTHVATSSRGKTPAFCWGLGGGGLGKLLRFHAMKTLWYRGDTSGVVV